MDFREHVRAYLPPLAVAREPEIVDELAQHMADLYQEARAAGSDHETALARATAALPAAADAFVNDLESASRALPGLLVDRWHAAHDTASSASSGHWSMIDMLRNIRVAGRSLLRTPGFSAVVVLTLAVGIGATTAIYSVVDAVLINPLPYPTQDRLQMIWVTNPQQEIDKDVTSYPNFADWQAQSTTFEAMAAVNSTNVTITGAGEPKLVPAERVTGRFFDLFGTPARYGRTLQPADTAAGRERVLVLSHTLWTEHFGADPGVVGRTVSVNALPFEVVGVMPEAFSAIHTAEAWAPLPTTGPFQQIVQSRGSLWLEVIGLTKPGVSRQTAQSEMSAIMARLAEQYPGNAGMGILLEPLKETAVGDMRATLLLIGGAVLLVLLIVCANVAGLLVARMSARQRELSVRVAIGAGRGHLIRQLLTESMLLGVAGSLAGIALAAWGLRVLLASRPANLPRAGEIHLSTETLVFAIGVGLVASLTFGLLPSFSLLRRNPADALRDDSRGSVGAAGRGMRRVLVIAEIALACVLVTGAGLLARSFAAIQADDPGFERERLFTMRLTLPGARYPEDVQARNFFTTLLERIEALPGVERAGAMSSLMLARLANSASLRIEGAPQPPPGTPNEPVITDLVSPGAFEAFGVPVTRGRVFNSGDVPDGLPVVMVNEAFVRRFYPDQDPLGRRVTFSGFDSTQPGWLTIVGVVGDTRRSFGTPVREELYFPLSQSAPYSMYIFVRTAAAPETVVASARQAVWSLDPELAIAQPRTIRAVMAAAVAEERFRMTLVAGFAMTAMLLAALGVYGLMAFATTQRQKEFGVRLALGATPRALLVSVMRDGLVLAGMGLAAGLAAAVAAARAMRQMLFGISPFDPVTFGLMAVMLLIVAALASFVPARRAMKVDPMVSLSR
ncbi:MAG TPA: ABC transporter permease [Vicinamibacterales bacterium]